MSIFESIRPCWSALYMPFDGCARLSYSDFVGLNKNGDKSADENDRLGFVYWGVFDGTRFGSCGHLR